MMATKELVLFALITSVAATGSHVNPIQKVIELLSSLEAKILKEGEAEEKAYKEFFEWCDDAARNKQFEMKTAMSEKAKLEATIAKSKSDAEVATDSIAAQVASIAQDQADLKAATEVRDKEHEEFVAAESELVDAVDTLERAIGIIEKNMKGSALLQKPLDTANIKAVMQTLSTIIDAASFSTHDKQTLLTLMQNKENSNDDDAELGAPDPDVYKSHSGGIVDVLEDMKEKAEGELSEARKAEMNAKHNYDMLKQSLVDEIAAAEHEKSEAETSKSEADATKATAEGDLAVNTKEIEEISGALKTVSGDCMTAASDHEVSVNGRSAELAALAKAKKIIQSSTSGAEAQSYSFFQISSATSTGSRLQTVADLRNFEVVNLVKRLAREQQSTALAQLASRISAVTRYSASVGEDPFAKVKGLITDMIDKLMKEAASEASFKAYCDEEMAKTKAKKEELTSDIRKLTSKIDTAAARSAGLKEDVKKLQTELANLAESQAEMDKVRTDEKAAYESAKADLEEGLTGVRGALKVLRDFYAASDEALMQYNFAAMMQQPSKPEGHSKASGAGGSIISMLEVIESDFAKNLAQITEEEEAAQSGYDKLTQENKVTKTMKEQDVKYKTEEFTSLDKELAELSSDRDSTQTELDAVLEYDTKIKDQCIAKPETYEERKKRREAEIAGLKEALSILEGQAVFMQGKGIRTNLRAHGRL